MPKRVDDFRQPTQAPTAADLGQEAYQASLSDRPGEHAPALGDQAGTVPQWKRPEPRNAPPGQQQKDTQAIKLGRDVDR